MSPPHPPRPRRSTLDNVFSLSIARHHCIFPSLLCWEGACAYNACVQWGRKNICHQWLPRHSILTNLVICHEYVKPGWCPYGQSKIVWRVFSFLLPEGKRPHFIKAAHRCESPRGWGRTSCNSLKTKTKWPSLKVLSQVDNCSLSPKSHGSVGPDTCQFWPMLPPNKMWCQRNGIKYLLW